MKYHSRASEELIAIDLSYDHDINVCIEEVMTINEDANFEQLPLDKLTLGLKTLPSTLKYAFLDMEKAKPVIILSQLDQEQMERLLEVL